MLVCKPSTEFRTTLQGYLYVLTHLPTPPLSLLCNLLRIIFGSTHTQSAMTKKIRKFLDIFNPTKTSITKCVLRYLQYFGLCILGCLINGRSLINFQTFLRPHPRSY